MIIQDLIDKLTGQAFQTEKESALSDILLIALAGSQQKTPVKTGTLRRSETTRVEVPGERGFLGTNVVYGPFVHEGTRKMEGRPFFLWGIQARQPQINKRLQQLGDRFFAEVAK
jgi:hypothetical protein